MSKINVSPSRTSIQSTSEYSVHKPVEYFTNQSAEDIDLVQFNVSGHVPPPTVDSRAVYQDDPFYFIMYVDIHDFSPHEVSVDVCNGGITVNANHEVDFKSMTNDQMHDESRSISERYSLPADLLIDTLRWNFTADKRNIIIAVKKSLDTENDTSNHFKNVEQREIVVERPNEAPLVYLQSYPQPFPGREQNQSSYARNIGTSYGLNQQPYSNYANFTGYNPSQAKFSPSGNPHQQYYY